VLLFTVLSCKKVKVTRLGNAPVITLVSLSDTSLVQFTGRITVDLRYEDGDGDLGHPHPDSLLMEVRDSRLLAPDLYFIPPIAPVGTSAPVQGNFRFTLNGTFLFGNGTTELTTYTIRLRDRAGNWSNTVATPAITIKRN
jgi:hypothetical protein